MKENLHHSRFSWRYHRSTFRRTVFLILAWAISGSFATLMFGPSGGLASIIIGAALLPFYGIWGIWLPIANTQSYLADYHELNIAKLGLSEIDYLKDAHKRAVANAERGADSRRPLPLLISLLLTAIWLGFLGWFFAI